MGKEFGWVKYPDGSRVRSGQRPSRDITADTMSSADASTVATRNASVDDRAVSPDRHGHHSVGAHRR